MRSIIKPKLKLKVWEGDDHDELLTPASEAPTHSEIALADEFSETNKHLRYVANWNKWLMWDGKCWREAQKLEPFDLARGVVSKASAALEEGGRAAQAKALAQARIVAAVVTLARSDPRHAASVEQWDTDPWLLNTPGGVVDLRSGEVAPHAEELYCTKMTAIAPADHVPDDCLWLRALKQWSGSDQQLVDFLQRAAGYSLTGLTNEEVFFFLHGLGQNGKTKFLEAIMGAVGDYHEYAAMETFTASKFDHHPADLAKLRAARIVTAVETEEGRRWAEAKIKAITGGDPISARFMRQDFFTYKPQFKLWVAGNHKPGLRNVDVAMRRRLNLVPFTMTIPESERDRELSAKLKAEWSIVLRWTIDGCLMWQRDGLSPPNVVTAATSSYMAEEDVFAQWLEDCCEVNKASVSTVSDLWDSWKAWAEGGGEFVGTKKKFAQQLIDRNFTQDRRRGARVYLGLTIVGKGRA